MFRFCASENLSFHVRHIRRIKCVFNAITPDTFTCSLLLCASGSSSIPSDEGRSYHLLIICHTLVSSSYCCHVYAASITAKLRKQCSDVCQVILVLLQSSRFIVITMAMENCEHLMAQSNTRTPTQLEQRQIFGKQTNLHCFELYSPLSTTVPNTMQKNANFHSSPSAILLFLRLYALIGFISFLLSSVSHTF